MSVVSDIQDVINEAVSSFDKRLPKAQKEALQEILLLSKELDTDGRIKPSVKKIAIVNRIKQKLNDIFLSEDYKKDVNKYLESFNKIEVLNNTYYGKVFSKFAPGKLLGYLKTESIELAKDSLLGSGMKSNVVNKASEILTNAATNGGQYKDFVKEMTLFLDENEGQLTKYVKQITKDSLSQYHGSYAKVVTDDIGFEWFEYTGVIIETSRTFCEAMVKKRYFHKSEIKNLLSGNFEEFKELDGELNPKTKLPYGMIAGTNESNFFVRRGGYSCEHQIFGVSKYKVPLELRQKFESKEPKLNQVKV